MSAATALALDCSGDVLVAGGADGGTSGFDLRLVKYTADGHELWTAKYNGPVDGSDSASSLSVDCAGSVHVTGKSDGPGGSGEYATLKYDANGNQLWLVREEGSTRFEDGSSRIALDPFGGVYVAGTVRSAGGDRRGRYGVWRYDSSGRRVWAWYDGLSPGDGTVSGLQVDAQRGVYVTGSSEDATGLHDFASVKLVTSYPFARGDCNGDGRAADSVTDSIFLLRYLFLGGDAPPCLAACDADGDENPSGFIADAVYLLLFNFQAGMPPPPPFPQCGASARSALECEASTGC